MAKGTAIKARHQRSLTTILRALVAKQHAVALFNILRFCDRPVDFLKRYLARGGGVYPDAYTIKTPIGPVRITVFTPDDVMTINEIFFRLDYQVDNRPKIYVDFGSNVGISTLYWLSRNRENFVYCFEPLPQNVERLTINLAGFEDRYALQPVAVGETEGMVEFGWEPTGRYGGIGRDLASSMMVKCVDSNSEIRRILDKHGRIGVLKIDIESLEKELTVRIPQEDCEKIELMVIEKFFDENPHPATHALRWREPITRLERHSLNAG